MPLPEWISLASILKPKMLYDAPPSACEESNLSSDSMTITRHYYSTGIRDPFISDDRGSLAIIRCNSNSSSRT